MPKTKCSSCAATWSFGYHGGLPYCKDCIRNRAFAISRTPGEFASLATRLAALGELIPEAAIGTAKRHQEEVTLSGKAIESAAASLPSILAAIPTNPPATLGDEVIGDDLQDMLDGGSYYLHHWLPESEFGSLTAFCATHPSYSVMDLLNDALKDKHLLAQIDSVLYALLGSDLTPHALVLAEEATSLSDVNAFCFSLGLGRMVELSGLLRDGIPPIDYYSEDERALLIALEPETVRRTSRSWHYLSALTSDIKTLNDRAERLMNHWLLYPAPEPIREYQQLLYRSYIHSHDAECTMVCRSLLERVVVEALLALGGRYPEKMDARLRHLNEAGKLSDLGLRCARDVWARGNRVVHSDPRVPADPFPTIASVLHVARELATEDGNSRGLTTA